MSYIMKLPPEPKKEDCCNSGCNPCIFDVYEKQLRLYNKKLESEKTLIEVDYGISPLEYSVFIVMENTQLCESHRIISFQLLDNTNDKKVSWKPGDHFLIKYSTMNSICTRAYTPVKLNNCSGKYDFSVVVKMYQNGLVSQYLGQLNIGSQTLWRGPYGSYELIPNNFSRIFMLAQGTGIAPFPYIITSILENEDDFSKIICLYCCESISKIIFRDLLCSFQSYWNFTYEVFVNTSSLENILRYKEPVTNHKFCYKDMDKYKPFTTKDQFLICGSTYFMESHKTYLQSEAVLMENIFLF